jgi:DnaJ like chaperone protein
MKKTVRETPDVKRVAAMLKKMTSHEERVWLLTLAWRVAIADGPANYSERTCLTSVGEALGLSDFQQQRLASEYLHPKNQNYDVLGINPAASVDLIRRAYKQMARDNHPDRVSHLGEFKARQANEKFARITQAYDAIRKERGF